MSAAHAGAMTSNRVPRPAALAVSLPRRLLHLEGAALLAAATAAFFVLGGSWWVFPLLLLAPDLAMLGYLAGPRVGAVAYDAAHTTVAPLALFGAAALLGAPLLTGLALIWLAHIGMDRAVGYGLKYPSDFRDTHLQRV
jgi:hypothetical protein